LGGEDFPFATRAEFVTAIEDGGVAAMEVLARDLRALGLYTARSLSDLAGAITGAHRTWLALDGSDKAPIDTQRKAMGDLLGHAVRFGRPSEIMAVGGRRRNHAVPEIRPAPYADGGGALRIASRRLPVPAFLTPALYRSR